MPSRRRKHGAILPLSAGTRFVVPVGHGAPKAELGELTAWDISENTQGTELPLVTLTKEMP